MIVLVKRRVEVVETWVVELDKKTKTEARKKINERADNAVHLHWIDEVDNTKEGSYKIEFEDIPENDQNVAKAIREIESLQDCQDVEPEKPKKSRKTRRKRSTKGRKSDTMSLDQLAAELEELKK